MPSTLIACYLFLGGAGAGALFLLAIRELFLDKSDPNSQLVYAPAYAVSLVALIVSVLCLMADLGRLDRLVFLFIHPSWSYMTLGTYALSLLIICAAILTVRWNLKLPQLRSWLIRGVQIVGALLALVVMVYTGLFLQSIDTVVLWASPFIPVLFVLSSFSTGIALLLGSWYFSGTQQIEPVLFRRFVALDVLLILLELISFAVFYVTAQANSELSTALLFVVTGEYANLFWAGFVFCGLAAPLALEALLLKQKLTSSLALVAGAVLVGGFCLRLFIIDAGLQPALWGL